MRMVTSREIRQNPAVLWKEDFEVITSNGKPVAVVVKVEDEDIFALEKAIRSAKARIALEKLRRYSMEKEYHRLSEERINEIVREARSEGGR